MDRITITLDENGHIVRICADAGVEVYLVPPHVPRDRVYRWGSPRTGREDVDEEIGRWAHRRRAPLAPVALTNRRARRPSTPRGPDREPGFV